MKIFKKRFLNDDEVVITKWYYQYKDFSGKLHVKVCKGCNSFEEAKIYVSNLKYLYNDRYLIKNIAEEMYLEGSPHVKRLASFGKKLCRKTLLQKRQIINLIIKTFGDEDIRYLKISKIEKYLIDDSHSGSWKNSYLETFGAIYDETVWFCDYPVNKPSFQKFSRNSKKADIFTTEELNLLFESSELWENYKIYLLFYMIASCGLRLGEARGLKVNQFNLSKKMLLINGFCKDDGFRTDYNKKGSSEDKKLRLVPLPLEAVYKISQYIGKNKLNKDDFLFTDEKGRVYTSIHLRTELKRVIQSCNINTQFRKLCPHSLRFTYVTRMRRECSAEDVQKIVGHNSVNMTEYYTRFSIRELESSIKNTVDCANRIFC